MMNLLARMGEGIVDPRRTSLTKKAAIRNSDKINSLPSTLSSQASRIDPMKFNFGLVRRISSI